MSNHEQLTLGRP